MIRVNKLTQLEGRLNVGEFGENGDEIIRGNKLTQLEGTRNVKRALKC